MRVRMVASAALVAGGLAACARRPAGSVTLQLSSRHPIGGPDSAVAVRSDSDGMTLISGMDTLFVRQVELVIQNLEIAPADAGDCEGTPDEHEEECPMLAAGPMIVALPPGLATRSALTVRLPADAYSLLQFQIQTPDPTRDAEFLDAHPEYRQGSVRLRGLYSRRGVRARVDYWARFNEREELALEPRVVVNRNDTTTLTLQADVAKWFLNAERTEMVDPGTAGPGQPYESVVRDNIRTSLRAFAASPAPGAAP